MDWPLVYELSLISWTNPYHMPLLLWTVDVAIAINLQ